MFSSVCCSALPLWMMHEYEDEWYGLCSQCKEHTHFNYIEEENNA